MKACWIQTWCVRWRLIDLWNDLYLVGLACLGVDRDDIRPREQPELWEAFAVVALVCTLCMLYSRKRVQAVRSAYPAVTDPMRK